MSEEQFLMHGLGSLFPLLSRFDVGCRRRYAIAHPANSRTWNSAWQGEPPFSPCVELFFSVEGEKKNTIHSLAHASYLALAWSFFFFLFLFLFLFFFFFSRYFLWLLDQAFYT